MSGLLVHMLFVTGVVSLIVRYSARERRLCIHALASFLLKVMAGFGLAYYYFNVTQGGDTLAFHQEAVRLADWAERDFPAYFYYLIGSGKIPFESVFDTAPRAQFVSKWASVIYLIGPDHYWLSSLYFSLFSWTGLWIMTMALYRTNERWLKAALFSLLYFPSVMFWSSGLTKESLAVGALAILLGVMLRFRRQALSGRITGILLLLLSGYILWQVKYFYAAVLILSLLTGYALSRHKLPVSIGWRLILLAGVLALGWILLGKINPNLAPSYLPEVVYNQYEIFVQKSEPGKYVEFTTLCPTWGCVLLTFPYAAASGLFLPFPFDAWSVWSFCAGMENVLLLALTVLYLLSLRKGSIQWTPLQVSGWFYCILLAAFLAMSAPNIGTLVRYRVGFLPVFVLLITLNNSYFYRGADALTAKARKLIKR